MTESMWREALLLFKAKGTRNEQLMATLLLDLLVLPSAQSIFDGATLRILEAA